MALISFALRHFSDVLPNPSTFSPKMLEGRLPARDSMRRLRRGPETGQNPSFLHQGDGMVNLIL